jgi:hypothetical protein
VLSRGAAFDPATRLNAGQPRTPGCALGSMWARLLASSTFPEGQFSLEFGVYGEKVPDLASYQRLYEKVSRSSVASRSAVVSNAALRGIGQRVVQAAAPALQCPGIISATRTFRPGRAQTSAMPAPIWPQPTTPTVMSPAP